MSTVIKMKIYAKILDSCFYHQRLCSNIPVIFTKRQ